MTVNGDSNLKAANIKSGTSIFGITGNYSPDLTISEATVRDGYNYTDVKLQTTNSPMFTSIKSGVTVTYYYYEWYYDCSKTITNNDYILFFTFKLINVQDGYTSKYGGGHKQPLKKFSTYSSSVGSTQLVNWRYFSDTNVDIYNSNGNNVMQYSFKVGINPVESKFRMEYSTNTFLDTTSSFNTSFKFWVYS